ncbi:hypothetical protein [Streptomyces sp. NRRL F-5135]|uniref:hypothetical protein n=1 Tax=Streptomyces sp. NRRL F-5135 TaxID=1463858 RepID=UPI00131BCBB1|nr:hypothetical protein [Streptomyces sp. NRRL F-5135]
MTAHVVPLEKLGREVDLRITELGLEYAEVARAAEISVETLSKIRRGARARAVTYRRLERALRWESGSVDAILKGGVPRKTPDDADLSAEVEVETDPQTVAVMTILDALPRRVRAEVLRRLRDQLTDGL